MCTGSVHLRVSTRDTRETVSLLEDINPFQLRDWYQRMSRIAWNLAYIGNHGCKRFQRCSTTFKSQLVNSNSVKLLIDAVINREKSNLATVGSLSDGPRGVEANRDGAWKLNGTRHSHDTWTRGRKGTRKETRQNVCRSIKVIRDIEGIDRGTISPISPMATFHDGQYRNPRLDSRPIRVLPPAYLRSTRSDFPRLDVIAPDPRTIDRHIAYFI